MLTAWLSCGSHTKASKYAANMHIETKMFKETFVEELKFFEFLVGICCRYNLVLL